MTDNGRTVIIGAGHNGLVCAAYLARAGREVTVLEASDAVGGMAATREFAPGYRVSCAHLVYLLDAGIVQELALPAHGLRFAAEGLSTIALDPVGEHLSIEGDRLDGPGVSAADHDAWPAYRRRRRYRRGRPDRFRSRSGSHGWAASPRWAHRSIGSRRRYPVPSAIWQPPPPHWHRRPPVQRFRDA